MKLKRILGNRILVEHKPEKATSDGGILLPECARDNPREGIIKQLGSKALESELQVGNRVLLPSHSGGLLYKEGTSEFRLHDAKAVIAVYS